MPTNMSKHFTVASLLRYTAASVAMMIFLSVYEVVDGFFVSNFVGSTALAAVNFTYPIFLILGTIGYMMGMGGSAIVAKTLGEGDSQRANELFSLFVFASIAAGVLFTCIGIPLLEPLLRALGAEGALLDECMSYGVILLIGIVFDVLQYIFQSFVMTAGKPSLGMWITIAAGLTNVVLDFMFIAVFGWGIAGAAWATIIGCAVGGVLPLIFFVRKNPTLIRLGRPSKDWNSLGKAAANGSSEMVTNIAMALVAVAYNVQLIGLIGEAGVAAYGVIGYVVLLFAGAFIGYSTGCAPLMSYQHGAKNQVEMNSLFRKSLCIIGAFGVVMFIGTRILAHPISLLFVGYDADLMALTEHAFSIYSVSFLVMGFNVYASSLFTSLNNGLVSALVSFIRTLVFEIGCVFLLPVLLGADGVWYSVTVAETLALIVAALFSTHLLPTYGIVVKRAEAGQTR